MSAHTKEKIICHCSHCGTSKLLPPSLAKSFSFCSNKCKWEANKQIVRYNKLPTFRYAKVQCQNEFCNKVISLLPCRAKRRKHCCRACKVMVESAEYPVLIQQKRQEQDKQLKKQIWFVR